MTLRRVFLSGLVAAVFAGFVAVDLVAFGLVPLASPLVSALPLVGLVLGAGTAAWGSHRTGPRPPTA